MIYNLLRNVKNIVTKGDLIALDLDGNGNKQYRVIKCNGNVAQVMAMYIINEVGETVCHRI